MNITIYSILFTVIGLFSIVAAAADWDFFMNSRRAAFFLRVFGRNGARIFYILLGLGIMSIGVLGGFGIIDLSS